MIKRPLLYKKKLNTYELVVIVLGWVLRYVLGGPLGVVLVLTFVSNLSKRKSNFGEFAKDHLLIFG